jgi:hypothetical protein
MKCLLALLPIMFVPMNLMASDEIKATYSDETIFLGTPGTKISIVYKDQRCTLSSDGDADMTRFTISLNCNGLSQILWNKNSLGENDLALDDPKFELEWAGDIDKDGKLDLKMELSQKYSCSRKVTFLSSLAQTGKLVDMKGNPKMTCGE